ncbi:MAG: lysophospholipid acyltransferase family protein [Desulfomonile sp.]|nr:lysophospholipid acyltransferase family protein [Desulfomonile sp.]
MTEKKKEKGRRLWFRVLLFVLPRLVSAYAWLLEKTSKIIILNQEYEEAVCKRRPFVCACHHGTMLYPVYYCRRYPGVIMVSRSWDGELIDRCIRRWGFDTTRGSSSRGGKEALAEQIDMAKEKAYNAGIAVDAPRGPERVVKMGVVVLGRETGFPVLPLVSWSTRQIQFNSWDRMIVPLPFSTIVMVWGSPVEIPKGLERDEYEVIRRNIEEDMLRISDQAVNKVRELLAGAGAYAAKKV